MSMKYVTGACVIVLLSIANLAAAAADLADAAMKKDKQAIRALLQKKADVNAPQIDGATALHWAVQWDDLETVELLIKAGANVKAVTRTGGTAMSLAAINGNAAMLDRLLAAGAEINAPLTMYGDTALMLAARTGKPDAVKVLLDHGANINAKESWGNTTALMYAAQEKHTDVVQLLAARGADINARSKIVPVTKGGGGADRAEAPRDLKPNEKPASGFSGGLTALGISARDGDQATADVLIKAGADLNALSGDGKTPLVLAIYNGHYDLASFLIDKGSDVNLGDADAFTPLFLAVDRRNMEVSNTIPWIVTADPLPLIEKLLVKGADPNARVKNTPTYRGSIAGQTRLRYAGGTALTRAAFSGDLTLTRLLLKYGADPTIATNDHTTPLMAAAGYGFIDTYSVQRTEAERLAVLKTFVELGGDINEANNLGITPIMTAAHIAQLSIIQYLVDQGADLSAHDTGKGNGASTEPLMPIDYAVGVTTFQPNAIVYREKAVELIQKMMDERGIKHTTSECTLRGFTCADIDPKTATPAQIQTLRKRQQGNRVEGITGGLGVAPKQQ